MAANTTKNRTAKHGTTYKGVCVRSDLRLAIYLRDRFNGRETDATGPLGWQAVTRKTGL